MRKMAAIDDKPARRDIKELMVRAEALRKRAQKLHDEVADIEQVSQDRLARTTVLIEKAQRLYKDRNCAKRQRKKFSQP